MQTVTNAYEFNDFPMRHLEDKIIRELSKALPIQINEPTTFYSDPHYKAYILLLYFLFRMPLPIEDFKVDTNLMLN